MTPEEFARRLNDSPQIINRWRIRTMQRIVLVVEANVTRKTPVVWGTLAGSITSRIEDSGQRGVVGTNLIYARPVNRRRQYMERGLEASTGRIEQILEERGGVLAEELSQ